VNIDEFGCKAFDEAIEQGYNMVPLYRRLSHLDLCPIKIFKSYRDQGAILLHSSRTGGDNGRYSIIAFDAIHDFKSKGSRVEIDGVVLDGDPITSLELLIKRYRGFRLSDAPLYCGGPVGYFGYECCHYFEAIDENIHDDLEMPDIYLKFCTSAIIIDHLDESVIAMSVGDNFKDVESRVDSLSKHIQENSPKWTASSTNNVSVLSQRSRREDYRSNFDFEDYLRAIESVKDYIIAGDTFQVNLSQRLELDTQEDSLDIYQRLVEINPVHFSSFIEVDGLAIICGSPERLCKVCDGVIEARPIAGTRRKGNPEEEQAFIRELLTSEKEVAEHSMLVDLDRNDLGRVCEYGEVEIGSLMEIIHYSHVMHIESIVKGKLRDGVTPIDVLAAKFPGGTITGAPKVRTMEIISELEPNKRGIYTGSIGYFSFTGELDLNIVIRTIVQKDDRAYVQVGGGIVHDSMPAREYKETLNKARAQLEAL